MMSKKQKLKSVVLEPKKVRNFEEDEHDSNSTPTINKGTRSTTPKEKLLSPLKDSLTKKSVKTKMDDNQTEVMEKRNSSKNLEETRSTEFSSSSSDNVNKDKEDGQISEEELDYEDYKTVTTPIDHKKVNSGSESKRRRRNDYSSDEDQITKPKNKRRVYIEDSSDDEQALEEFYDRSRSKVRSTNKPKVKRGRSRSRSQNRSNKKRKSVNDAESKVKDLMQQVTEMAQQLKELQDKNNKDQTKNSRGKPFRGKGNKNTNIDNTGEVGKQTPQKSTTRAELPIVKSPSDTTIYAPAVRLEGNLNYLNENEDRTGYDVNVINEFLNNVRIESTAGTQRSERNEAGHSAQAVDGRGGTKTDEIQANRAEEAIIAAERYKAAIQAPPAGTEFNNDLINLKMARYLDNDDDEFFHITCHVDANLRAKIHRGEYVDLEKLLVKPESLMYKKTNRYQMNIVDGEQIWSPAEDKSTKIDGVRKWENAFRTYAAIYCEKNPTRSVEILQYIESINDAAKKFIWDKVAHYDFVFRHLQAERPHRNWGKTYMQMYVRLLGNDHSHMQQQ